MATETPASAGTTPRPIPGDGDVRSNWDNFNVEPGETHVLLDAKGPGVITHIWFTFLGPSRRTGRRRARPTTRRCCCGSTGTARPRPAVEAPAGRFLRQLLRPARRGHQPAGRRRGRRLVQLLLADAVPQVGPDRDRQPEREADQPALLQHRLDQEGLAAGRHAVLLRPVPAGISRRRRARTT